MYVWFGKRLPTFSSMEMTKGDPLSLNAYADEMMP